MELTGKIIKVLPLQSGSGKNGVWKKQEFVIETNDKIARKVCFSLWGDKIDQYSLSEGDPLELSFDIESREFNGRWYTEVKAWKVVKKGTNSKMDEIPPDLAEDSYSSPESDLPF